MSESPGLTEPKGLYETLDALPTEKLQGMQKGLKNYLTGQAPPHVAGYIRASMNIRAIDSLQLMGQPVTAQAVEVLTKSVLQNCVPYIGQILAQRQD